MPFEVTILGSNSAIPAYGRNHTSHFVQVKNKRFLIDCGEGTQHQMRRYGLKAQQLDVIFISHLHGDHYLGLVGLLSSLHLQGRKRELLLYGPKGLDEIITLQLKYSETVFNYNLRFIEVDTTIAQVIYEDARVHVSTIPLEHRIPCSGYLIKEQPHPYRINKTKISEDIGLQDLATLKQGKPVIGSDGAVIYDLESYTLPPKISRAYAFCSDTKYDPDLHTIVNKVDLLYHESTFLNERELTASNTFHSTAAQAAQVAKDADVGKLLIGHFSARYKDIRPFEAEARLVFERSHIAIEGKSFAITH